MCICPADCSRVPQLSVMPWIPEGCQSWCSALLLLGTAGHLPCKQDKHSPSAKQARNHSLSLYGHGNSSEHQEGFGLLEKEEKEKFSGIIQDTNSTFLAENKLLFRQLRALSTFLVKLVLCRFEP